MKKVIIAAALFVSAGLCVSASLLPSKTAEPTVAPAITNNEPANDGAARNLGTAD